MGVTVTDEDRETAREWLRMEAEEAPYPGQAERLATLLAGARCGPGRHADGCVTRESSTVVYLADGTKVTIDRDRRCTHRVALKRGPQAVLRARR